MTGTGQPDDPSLSPEQAETAYQDFVRSNLRRNYAANFLHGMMGMTGFRLINTPTFLPAFIHTLTASDAIVGLALSLQQIGNLASPIVGASQVEHRKRVLPVAQVIGSGMRLPLLGIALSGWFAPKSMQLPIVVLMLAIWGLFNGMQRVAFQVLLAKVIPVAQRGRLQAWRNLTGGVIAAALAYFAGRWFLEANVLGNGYSTTFLLAFILTSAGLSALSMMMREPVPPKVRAPTPVLERLKDFPALMRGDRAFTFFTLVLVLAMLGRAANPFYILFAAQTIKLTGANIGLLSLAFLGADTVSNLIWGYLGDRFGFRVIMIASILLWIASTLVLMFGAGVGMIFLAFIGLGASGSGYQMSTGTMVLEFGARDDMPMRLAITSTAEGTTAAVGPLLGGIVAAVLGYRPLFVGSIIFLLAALTTVLLLVEEPRLRRLARERAAGGSIQEDVAEEIAEEIAPHIEGK